MNNLLLSIIVPVAVGALLLLLPNKVRGAKEAIALLGTAANVAIAALLFKQDSISTVPWFGFGFEFSLRIYNFSAFIVAATACFGFLVTLYSTASLQGKSYAKLFYSYLLLMIGFVNGAVLSDNLVVTLFFWEGLLITLFGMIAIGKKDAFKTATKAFIIIGITDLCMMLGIALSGHQAGTFTISKIALSTAGVGGIAFMLLMIGTISKAGSMPFHTWIPDAAADAPLPFMAIVPGAIEKLVGIYFLARLSMDMFKLETSSWASYTLMIIGAVTIIFAVMMALVQKDYKRLLSYHAISQVGYMILGIGTALPVGIIGGLFHMINNALYKSCLFLTGGAAERQAGTTDLEKLGGLWSKMPVTFICFTITALSISGVPPFNGFFSKELVYDGALERGWIFYGAAVVGSFLTAASFLKLGHAAFLGKLSDKNRLVKEAPIPMLIPMITIAVVCILFGVFNAFPIDKILVPILGAHAAEGHHFSGFPTNMKLVVVTVIVLIAALLNHLYGVKKTGRGLGAVDHIHYAPGLHTIYNMQEKGYLDPYNIGMGFVNAFAIVANWCDKAINWIYDSLSVSTAYAAADAVRRIHDGSYKTYIAWSVAAGAIIMIFFLKS
jgi:formate hydrogenlyase subunit 3/multisubunit Na+/H+ antiporter MnhD subunit